MQQCYLATIFFEILTEMAVLLHPLKGVPFALQRGSRIKTLLNELWGDELQHSVGSLVSAYRNFKKAY